MTALELAQRDFRKALKAHSHASVRPNVPAEELLHLLELVKLRKEIVEIISRADSKQSEGEWVYGENDQPHCSECGHEPKEVTPFCPICGTNMERSAE